MIGNVHRVLVFCLCTGGLLALGCQSSNGTAQRLRAQSPQRFQTSGAVATRDRRAAYAAALNRVQLLVQQRTTALRLPSIAAAVVVDGEAVWWETRGLRDLQGRDAVTPHTVYRIGSITKPLTAMAVLRLRDQGRLNLDTPVQNWLPELSGVVYPHAQSALITTRHLLTHTSGLPRVGKIDYANRPQQPVSEAELLGSLAELRLENEPGTQQSYSNLGYALLGPLIARVSGMGFVAYMERHVLTPMGLRDFAWDAVSCRDRLATGYTASYPQPKTSHHWLFGAAASAGGLYASLDDMIRLVAYHQTAWPVGSRPDLPPLASATLRESHMLGGFQLPTGSGSGAGWGVGNLAPLGHVVYHTGATHQYVATMIFAPRQRVGFVALTNVGTPEVTRSLDALAGDVLRTLVQAGAQTHRLRNTL